MEHTHDTFFKKSLLPGIRNYSKRALIPSLPFTTSKMLSIIATNVPRRALCITIENLLELLEKLQLTKVVR